MTLSWSPQATAGADHPRSRRHRRPLYGHQEGPLPVITDCYCYLPLYGFCGASVGGQLRPATSKPARAASRRSRDRPANPRPLAVRAHLLRADSGFAREALMAWCEQKRVDYLSGSPATPPGRHDRRGACRGKRLQPRRPAARRAASRTSSGRRLIAGAKAPRRRQGGGTHGGPTRASS